MKDDDLLGCIGGSVFTTTLVGEGVGASVGSGDGVGVGSMASVSIVNLLKLQEPLTVPLIYSSVCLFC